MKLREREKKNKREEEGRRGERERERLYTRTVKPVRAQALASTRARARAPFTALIKYLFCAKSYLVLCETFYSAEYRIRVKRRCSFCSKGKSNVLHTH